MRRCDLSISIDHISLQSLIPQEMELPQCCYVATSHWFSTPYFDVHQIQFPSVIFYLRHARTYGHALEVSNLAGVTYLLLWYARPLHLIFLIYTTYFDLRKNVHEIYARRQICSIPVIDFEFRQL